ncbi:MAG: hypothetical protein CME96_07960, partial [Hyphomonas sp.]|nr:hypothetical protein [Hyphomonas sp.]
MKIARPLLAAPFLAALLLSACAAPDGKQDVSVSEAAQSAAEAAATEALEAEVEVADENAWTKGAMVAAANPEAVEAGLAILREGGTAVDAAIAVHAALGLVEPESSGIGGGGFMVYYDHASGEVTVFDGRERAPAAATPEYFMKDGEVMDFFSSWGCCAKDDRTQAQAEQTTASKAAAPSQDAQRANELPDGPRTPAASAVAD